MTSEPKPKEKPFPWRCPNCVKVQVRPAVVSYTARVKHDGRLHEVVIPKLRVPRCEACGELVFGNDADEQISAALRARLGLLSPDEIRTRREELGLTQKQLADALGVASESICRWETGAVIQSRAIDNLLRLFFEMPEVRARLTCGAPSPRARSDRPASGMDLTSDSLLPRISLMLDDHASHVSPKEFSQRAQNLSLLFKAVLSYLSSVEAEDEEAFVRSLAQQLKPRPRHERTRRGDWVVVPPCGAEQRFSPSDTERIRGILGELDEAPSDRRSEVIAAMSHIASLVRK